MPKFYVITRLTAVVESIHLVEADSAEEAPSKANFLNSLSDKMVEIIKADTNPRVVPAPETPPAEQECDFSECDWDGIDKKMRGG